MVVMGQSTQSPALNNKISPGKPETLIQVQLWREAAAAHVSDSISLECLQIFGMKTEKYESFLHFIEWKISQKTPKTQPLKRSKDEQAMINLLTLSSNPEMCLYEILLFPMDVTRQKMYSIAKYSMLPCLHLAKLIPN